MTLSLWSTETYESPVGEDVRGGLKGKKNEPEKKKAKKEGLKLGEETESSKEKPPMQILLRFAT
jgi:hypothetical protein